MKFNCDTMCLSIKKLQVNFFSRSLSALGYPHEEPGHTGCPVLSTYLALLLDAIGRVTKTRELFFTLLWSVYYLTSQSIVALTLLNLSEYHT